MFTVDTHMSVEHINRRGKRYYLHQGKTKAGKPNYFFSMKSDGTLAESVPEGYEIYENPNSQVFLRRIQPQLILDSEKAVLEKHLNKSKSAFKYIIDIKGKIVTIFESQQNMDSIEGLFERYPLTKSIETSTFVSGGVKMQ